MTEAIDVVVIGGYLGSGKTSLLNHLLRSGTGRRTMVLVNDFGSVMVEPELVSGIDDGVLTLANGCVCCSLSSPLIDALIELRERAERPELLVIEASGVADPEPIAHHAMIPGYRLSGIVVVVDAEAVRAREQHALVGRTVRRQLAAAGLVVVNKTDLVSASALDALHDWLAVTAPSAALVDAVQGAVPTALVVGPDLATSASHAAEREDVEHDHVLDDPHLTVTWRPAGTVDRAALLAVLEDPESGIVRTKGVVAFADRPDRGEMVQSVGRRVHLSPLTAPTDHRLILIGLPPQFDPSAITSRLAATTDRIAP